MSNIVDFCKNIIKTTRGKIVIGSVFVVILTAITLPVLLSPAKAAPTIPEPNQIFYDETAHTYALSFIKRPEISQWAYRFILKEDDKIINITSDFNIDLPKTEENLSPIAVSVYSDADTFLIKPKSAEIFGEFQIIFALSAPHVSTTVLLNIPNPNAPYTKAPETPEPEPEQATEPEPQDILQFLVCENINNEKLPNTFKITFIGFDEPAYDLFARIVWDNSDKVIITKSDIGTTLTIKRKGNAEQIDAASKLLLKIYLIDDENIYALISI
jgi:hypothetical protein